MGAQKKSASLRAPPPTNSRVVQADSGASTLVNLVIVVLILLSTAPSSPFPTHRIECPCTSRQRSSIWWQLRMFQSSISQ